MAKDSRAPDDLNDLISPNYRVSGSAGLMSRYLPTASAITLQFNDHSSSVNPTGSD